MKYCSNCGAQLEDNATFCVNCGCSAGYGGVYPNPNYSEKKSDIWATLATVFSWLSIIITFAPGLAFSIVGMCIYKDPEQKSVCKKALIRTIIIQAILYVLAVVAYVLIYVIYFGIILGVISGNFY